MKVIVQRGLTMLIKNGKHIHKGREFACHLNKRALRNSNVYKEFSLYKQI